MPPSSGTVLSGPRASAQLGSGPADVAEGRPGRWVLLLLLFVGLIFNYIHRSALSVATPAIMHDLGLSKAAMGVLLSSFFWVYALLQVPLGWLTDRFGVKYLYGFSYAFWCMASMTTGLASSFATILALRILVGMGEAVVFPASTRAVAHWFPPSQRGTATGLYTTGVRVGIIIATVFGALLLTHYGWKMLFVISGAAGLPWLLGWFGFFAHYNRRDRTDSGREANLRKTAGMRGGLVKEFMGQARLLRYRATWGVSLGFLCYDYAWYVYVTWMPAYLMLDRHFSLKEAGLYASLPIVCNTIATPIAGILSDRLIAGGIEEIRARKLFLAGGLLLGCLIVPAGLVHSPYTSVALLSGSLFGLGFVGPNSWTITTAIAPRELVGTLAGVQNFWGNVGGIVAPALTGYIAYASGSFVAALMFTGAVLLLGAVFYVFLIPGKIILAAEAAAP